MPLRKLMKYRVPPNILGEKGLVELLKDVRKGLIKVDFTFEDKPLKSILKIAEKGVYQDADTEVDLSDARKLIDDYRRDSEGGCLSCGYKRKVHDDNETLFYCGQFETVLEINSKKRFSLMIEKHFEKGCDKIYHLYRSIDEVLKGL